jgi:hypothetical protein
MKINNPDPKMAGTDNGKLILKSVFIDTFSLLII